MHRTRAVLVAALAATAAALLVPALSGANPTPKTAPSGPPTKGIAVLMDAANLISDAKAMSIANSLFPILENKFHANSVSFSFPYWQAGSHSNLPERNKMTPSPQRLAAVSEIAHRYHLTVQWRPYLYEGNLTRYSRTSIAPTNPTAWINNYWNFIEPYLIAANQAGVENFSFAMELTTLMPYPTGHCNACLSQWETIIAKAKTVYSGALLYSQSHQPMVSLPLLGRGYDAYQPIIAATPSVGVFTKGFETNFQLAGFQSAPADLTIEELGIAAVAGANKQPYFEHYAISKTKLDRPLQEDWFQGACNAFWTLHLKGLYFWAIGFNGFTPGENNAKNLYAWYNTPTANVVSGCYARTS
jgi:hypothetical protein